ncbi:hypothetical protein GCM10023149_49160 [Mucilaginibacter gynuensis]|uniref:YD repeat-containing protein n=1 Tax=Mucilaginibacter gynuensis TaxID=1302236 RepID=A0ABP8HG75_9SPHI
MRKFILFIVFATAFTACKTDELVDLSQKPPVDTQPLPPDDNTNTGAKFLVTTIAAFDDAAKTGPNDTAWVYHYQYDRNRNITKQVHYSAKDNLTTIHVFVYDTDDNLVRIDLLDHDVATVVYEIAYQNGKPNSSTFYDEAIMKPATSYEVDGNNVTAVTNDKGERVTLFYNAGNLVKRQNKSANHSLVYGFGTKNGPFSASPFKWGVLESMNIMPAHNKNEVTEETTIDASGTHVTKYAYKYSKANYPLTRSVVSDSKKTVVYAYEEAK